MLISPQPLAGTPLGEAVAYLDDLLDIPTAPDYPGALNGLQVRNSGTVARVGAAVDAARATIEEAAAAGCDLLLVHHGLFWDGNRPLTGRRYERVRLLLEHDIALYSAHLPLDAHPEVGNNVLLATALGIPIEGRFAAFEGLEVGCYGRLAEERETFRDRLAGVVRAGVRLIPGGPAVTERVGVVTGGGSSAIAEARAAGVDTFVTGEAPHHAFFEAEEGGMNLLLAGHYATETFGVRALAERLAGHLGLEWSFLDHPTGL